MNDLNDINRELGEIKAILEIVRVELADLRKGRTEDYKYLDDKIDRRHAEALDKAKYEAEMVKAQIIAQGESEFKNVKGELVKALEAAGKALEVANRLEEQHLAEDKLKAELAKKPWAKFKAGFQSEGFKLINTLILAFIAFQVFEWVRSL